MPNIACITAPFYWPDKALTRPSGARALVTLKPLKYQYLLGQDLLVAPVHEQGRCDWTLYLPEDHWVNIWTGEAHHGGEITVDAPIGKPPVFYRAKSEWVSLFASLRNI